jgi:quercetin dioxygenase-like cupin family protein
MNSKINILGIIAFTFLSFLIVGCKKQLYTKANHEIAKGIFQKGELGPADHFIGKAYNMGLIPSDSIYNTLIGNVYFEPGARSNWHYHPSGQILIITDGEGYYQEIGRPRKKIKKGDVVKCLPNVLHWHGASPEIGMQQIYVLPNTEKGIVEWHQPVTDEEYHNKK